MARSPSIAPELPLGPARVDTAPRSWWSITLAQGIVAATPVIRTTARGEIAEIDLRTRAFVSANAAPGVGGVEPGPAIGITIVANPELVVGIEEGDEVLVTGTTRRRFFRVGGTTVARTEVEAVSVVRIGDRRRRKRTIDSAVGWIAGMSNAEKQARPDR